MPNGKKKVGVFTFSCDEGCSIYMIEIFNKKLVGWLEKMELSYFLSMKDRRDVEDFDIVLVEGAITSERDLKEILKVRKKTKILIGMGNCAITGMPTCQRNNFNESQLEEIKSQLEKFDFLPKCMSIKEVVRLDDEIPGCPISEEKFIEVFEKYI